jgi:DNA-nicking Smr family endonuclease
VAKKNISEKDSDLFRQAVGPVNPVQSDRIEYVRVTKPKSIAKPSVVIEDDIADYGNESYEKLGSEDRLSYSVPGVQKIIFAKLRKGFFKPGAKLDLHGLSRNEAKKQLVEFLNRCLENGCRCVMIVHGKGFRSTDQYPVLKNNLNAWLRHHKSVLAFCSAAPKDGGTGALWLLLQVSDKYRFDSE